MAMELEVASVLWRMVRRNRPVLPWQGSVQHQGLQQLQAGTGDGAEEAGYDNTYDGDTAFFVSYAGINEFDQSFGDTGFCMMFPDSTKNGIARSRNLLIPEYMLVATIVRDVPE